MDVSTNGHIRPEDVVPHGWRWSVPRFLGAAAFLAMALFWIWAFNNRDSVAHPDTFDDPAYTVAAESLCARRQAIINELPLATAAENAVERSELLKLGTAQLELMVAELGQLALPADPKGALGVPQWLADYELYLNDRRAYTDILSTGEDPPFLLSANASGARVTDALTTYADVNEMTSCGPSGDV